MSGRDHEMEMWLPAGLILGGAVIALAVWFPALLAHATSHTRPPGNPLTYGLRLTKHKAVWPRQATPWAVLEGIVIGLGLLVALVALVGRPRRNAVDRQARHLRVGPPHRSYTGRGDTADAPDVGRGRLIGPAVNSGKQIRSTWEDMALMIAGARMGKTTAHVVPTILDAPGAVYATSSKSDVVALTAALRTRQGSRIWVFDPQHIVGAEPSWWWNPLDLAHDVAGARRLAGIFSSATRPVGARYDASFHPESEELLAILLLAGALSRRSLIDVYGWVNRQSEEPVALLENAGFSLAAQGLDGMLRSPDRHRAPMFATAKQMLRWVTDPAVAAWVTDDGTDRRRFDADAFADTTDTVYSLAREGVDGAAPLTAALTAAVVGGAERMASRALDGRLSTPLVCCLDEVASVCRWRELPDLYAHCGSQGITLFSCLSSWSQGVECWGEPSMEKLWSSANVCIYGGGATEERFLEKLSRLCGDFDEPVTSSTSRRYEWQSVSRSVRRRRILEPSELAALPPGRAVVLLSGAPPVVVAPVSCFDGPHADEIRSILPATEPAVTL